MAEQSSLPWEGSIEGRLLYSAFGRRWFLSGFIGTRPRCREPGSIAELVRCLIRVYFAGVAFTLDIPDSVVAALGLSQDEARRELRQDMALVLYGRGVLSAGKAAEMAGITRMDFERLLCERQIVRSYSQEDLEHDLAWAKSQT